MPGSGAARHAMATNPMAAAIIAIIRDRRAMTIVAASPTPAVSTASVETFAYGRADTARAQTTRYAASHPSSQLSSAATSGTSGWSTAERSPMPSNGATTGAAIAFADHRVGGHRAELEEEDRRGCDSARDRDGDDCRRRPRHRIPLEPEHEARNEREDRGHRGKRQLEAGVEQVVRAPGEQHESSEQHEPPAVTLPCADPRERCKRSSDTRPHDGRLCADGKDVCAYGRECAHLARHARNPQQPRNEQHAARDESNVLARDGEQVVEARSAERVSQGAVEPFVLAEHDPEQHRTPLAGDARCKRRADGRPEPVGHPAEAASATDDLGLPSLQDHVHAVTAEPGSLVEAVFGAPGLGDEDRERGARIPGAASGPRAAAAEPVR